jgi:phage gpG-like protein
MNMNHDEFQKQLEQFVIDIKNYADNSAPAIIGKTAADFFKESFHNEGFTNNGLQPWKEVKRRINPVDSSNAGATRKILTGETGNLGRSIDYKVGTGKVVIFSDVKYAKIHNQGGRISGTFTVREYTRKNGQKVRSHSRTVNTTIPQRRFMGHSRELRDLILSELKRKIDSLKPK